MSSDGKNFLIAAIAARNPGELSQVGGGYGPNRSRNDRLTSDISNLASKTKYNNVVDSEDERIKQTSKDFEALLLHQMLNEMWKTVPAKEGILGGGREEEFYRDMFNEALAADIANGQGIGIKEVLERELRRVKNR